MWLKILSFFFPCVKSLIEQNNIRKKIIENDQKEVVFFQPFKTDHPEFITRVGSAWIEIEELQYVVLSTRQQKIAELLRNDDAEKYKNQIIGIEQVIKTFEGIAKRYEQLQVLQTKETQNVA